MDGGRCESWEFKRWLYRKLSGGEMGGSQANPGTARSRDALSSRNYNPPTSTNTAGGNDPSCRTGFSGAGSKA